MRTAAVWRCMRSHCQIKGITAGDLWRTKPGSSVLVARYFPSCSSSVVLAIQGVFTPVLAKNSKSFSLIDCLSVGVDRRQRNLEPTRKHVDAWQKSELTNATAKVVIYEAFVPGKLEAPKRLARAVHDLYLEPKIRGIPAMNNLESHECVHIGLQRTGSHLPI